MFQEERNTKKKEVQKMTVKEFLRMCDISECYIEYRLLITDINFNEHYIDITSLTDENGETVWVDEDTYDYDENNEVTALYKLTTNELLEKEIVSVKLGGSYANITVRL